MEQSTQFYDIASLVSCLNKLKSENRVLDEKLKLLAHRRDHLIAVNARLAIPCSTLNAINGLDGWENGNSNMAGLLANGNQQLVTSNGNSSAHTNESVPAANLFANYPNQSALAQANFASVHQANTSSPSPTTNQAKPPPNSTTPAFFGALANNLTNVNNSINSSLSNQSFALLNNGKSLDLNSNLSGTYYDPAMKQRESNSFSFTANNNLYQAAVNGQLLNLNNSMTGNLSSNLTSASNTSSPSKLNASSFNNSLTSSAGSSNLPQQLFQTFMPNPQTAFSLSQQNVQNSVLGQSKR